MPSRAPALLVLEDGRSFTGYAFGAEGETFGEAVFSTGMTGYQETLTDPSYHRQVVVMTAPHVGNTGMNDEDAESRKIWVAGYVVRDPARVPSNWRSQRSLDDEPARPGRRRHLRHRHPGPDPPPARARGDAGRHLHHRDRQARPAAARARLRRDGRVQPQRGGLDPRGVRRLAGRREALHRRRGRPGHQGQHAADDGRARHRGARAARDVDHRGRPGRRVPTGSSSPTAPATRRPRPARSSCSRPPSSATSPTSGSASATSSSAARWASAPTSSSTATAGSTSP